MKKHFIFIPFILIFISAFTINIFTEPAVLSQLLNPSKIVVGTDNIYILDNTSIYIYSKSDLSLKTKFGRKGEGPGEIPVSRRGSVSLTLKPLTDSIYLQSRNKVMYFDKKGKFIQEKRIKSGFVRGLLPVGKIYTGRSFSFGANRKTATSSVYLFDQNMNKKKELLKFNSTAGRGSFFKIYFPGNIFLLRTYKKKIYIVKDKNFKIEVFDINGNSLTDIKFDYKPLKVSSEKKQEIKNYYKNDSNFSNFWSRIKKFFSISDTYPAIKKFFVSNNQIYIQTYKENNGKIEFFILSTNGKIIKKHYLPLAKKNAIEDYPFDINGGKLYQLVENEDEEEWELNITVIN